MDPQIAAEGFTRVSFTLEPNGVPGVTKLTETGKSLREGVEEE